MDNSLNDSNAATTKPRAKNDDVKVDIVKEDVTHANDLLSSPNFLRIPLKPIEQPSNDEPVIEKTWVLSESFDRIHSNALAAVQCATLGHIFMIAVKIRIYTYVLDLLSLNMSIRTCIGRPSTAEAWT